MRRLLFSVIGLAVALAMATAGTALASVSSASADGTALLSASKIDATVTGTTVCTTGDTFSVSVIIQQTSGQTNTVGQGTAAGGTCTGTVQAWSVTASVFVGTSYKHGPASVLFEVSDSTDNTNSGIQSAGIKLQS
jgi:hypothetical protein